MLQLNGPETYSTQYPRKPELYSPRIDFEGASSFADIFSTSVEPTFNPVLPQLSPSDQRILNPRDSGLAIGSQQVSIGPLDFQDDYLGARENELLENGLKGKTAMGSETDGPVEETSPGSEFDEGKRTGTVALGKKGLKKDQKGAQVNVVAKSGVATPKSQGTVDALQTKKQGKETNTRSSLGGNKVVEEKVTASEKGVSGFSEAAGSGERDVGDFAEEITSVSHEDAAPRANSNLQVGRDAAEDGEPNPKAGQGATDVKKFVEHAGDQVQARGVEGEDARRHEKQAENSSQPGIQKVGGSGERNEAHAPSQGVQQNHLSRDNVEFSEASEGSGVGNFQQTEGAGLSDGHSGSDDGNTRDHGTFSNMMFRSNNNSASPEMTRSFELSLDFVPNQGQGSDVSQGQATRQTLSPREFLENFRSQFREHLSGDIVRQARFMFRGGNSGEISLVLKPEKLGKVRIKMNLQDKSIAGKIFVENKIVEEAFRDVLHDLKEAFVEQGFEDLHLDVALDDGSGGGETQPGLVAADDAVPKHSSVTVFESQIARARTYIKEYDSVDILV